ncbi:MAG: glycosyltransferase [Actinomycetota bacterium]|nr:glycosyltransferase [Actinomycetota bacterium]
MRGAGGGRSTPRRCTRLGERPLRVVYVDHCAQLSGGQLALARLLDALSGSVEAHVILAEDGPLVTVLEHAGHATEVLPMPEPTRSLRGVQVGRAMGPRPVLSSAAYTISLARRIRRLRPDIVHTNSLKAALYGPAAARLARRPVVVHVRDRIETDFLPPTPCRIVRTAVRFLPHAVLGNETTLSTLGRLRTPSFEVADPVDPRCFEIARNRGLPSRLVVGMVGRLDRWKGQHIFLEAFARAFPRGCARAVIVGSPVLAEAGYQQELRALAGTLGIAGDVEFRGFRADVPSELARLDIAVHASVIPEPFGQVVTEAMAAGLAIVAADAGGPSRIITSGVDGLLTPPGDAAALARELRRLADDPALRARLGSAGRRRARAFSGAVAAGQALTAYRTVLDRLRGLRPV